MRHLSVPVSRDRIPGFRVLEVATDPALAASSGGYRRSLRRRERSLGELDPELSAGLWRESVRLPGVDLPS